MGWDLLTLSVVFFVLFFFWFDFVLEMAVDIRTKVNVMWKNGEDTEVWVDKLEAEILVRPMIS